MRLLSALGYEDIEEYINYLPEVEVIDIAKDKRMLLDMINAAGYDLVLVSKELPGSEDIEHVIEVLVSNEINSHRIVFIYGEYDYCCDDFIRFLINHGIYDFYVGTEITSRDIERLIFRPVGKNSAFGYYQSRFDNERYFNEKGHKQKQNNSFLSAALFAGSDLKPSIKNKSYSKIPFEKLIISIISNQATGKSHTAWNLGCCLSKRGYSTSLINIDRGYSANLFFNIDEIYYDLLDFTIQNNKHRDILDNCCKVKNLNIITGKLGDEKEIGDDDFLKLLYNIRTKSDITIIDTRTGLSALTRESIKNSTYDLLVFDSDIMHFHMNMSMLEELKDDFVPEKTIAVINNTNVKSQSYKFIYNELISTGISFKDIASISSCGFLSSEVMHTGLSPYHAAEERNKDFRNDIDSLLEKLGSRPGRYGLAGRLFRKQEG